MKSYSSLILSIVLLQAFLIMETKALGEPGITFSIMRDEQINPDGGPEWSYFGDTGPEKWKDMGYSDCGKDAQSPLFINGNQTSWIYKENFKFNDGYTANRDNVVLQNKEGKWVRIYLPDWETDEGKACVTGGSLGEEYCVYDILFHFGDEDKKGFEHQYSMKNNPMVPLERDFEMQIFHLNADKTRYFVFIVTFKVNENSKHAGLDPIVDNLPAIKYRDAEITIDQPINVAKLLPLKLDGMEIQYYFRYNGSLTFPPCTEIVTWNLFRAREYKIGNKQIEAFRTLLRSREGEDELPMSNNFRPLQKRNDREIIDRNPFKDQ